MCNNLIDKCAHPNLYKLLHDEIYTLVVETVYKDVDRQFES